MSLTNCLSSLKSKISGCEKNSNKQADLKANKQKQKEHPAGTEFLRGGELKLLDVLP